MTRAFFSLVTGIDSPVTIRFIERGMAFQHGAVDRHLVARAHAQFVAGVNVVERDFFIGAIVLDAARGLGREI